MKALIVAASLGIALSLAACSPASPAGGPALLSKADAAKIITGMGYQKVAIGGVVQGVGFVGMGAFSSSSVAMIVGYAERDGRPEKIQQPVFYDKENGWFYYEIDTTAKCVRLWTVNGVSEATQK